MTNIVTHSPAGSKAAAGASDQSRIDPLRILAGTILVITIPLHFVDLSQPLWFDEVATGAIAAQATIGAVLRQILFDLNAPLYYLLAHFCARIFGLSDLGLRLPCAILAAAAPVAALSLRGPFAKDTRLLWAILLALWVPGFQYAQDARCYALVLFLATIDTVLFARLVISPERRTACAWAANGLLLSLTHYHALLLIGLQGVILIARHRDKAIALWPAALIFVPLPFWMALHLSIILRYLDRQNVWYWLSHGRDIAQSVDFLINSASVGIAAALILILTRLRGAERKSITSCDPLWLVAFASLVPAVAVVAAGFIRPSFSVRYLMTFGPGVLFGLALIGQSCRPYWRPAPLVLLLIFALGTANWTMERPDARDRLYSFEAAAQSLVRSGTKRLVFFWDNPAAKVMDARLLAAIGGFFFKRAGVPVEIIPVKPAAGEDPNLHLAAMAKKNDAAILWLYDTYVVTTEARRHPFAIAVRDPSWRCRNFAGGHIGVIACERAGVSDMPGADPVRGSAAHRL